MGSVKRIDSWKQKSGRKVPKPWMARYRGPDGKQHSKTFSRKVDAEQWLLAEESKAQRGVWTDPTAGAVSYEEWSQHWLKSRHGLTAKTRDGYESLLRSRILPTFGRTEIRHITPPAVRQWASEMVEDLSPARIKQALQVLRASLDMAVDDGLIARNPTDRVKAPPAHKRRQLFLSADQLEDLADTAEDVREGSGGLILIRRTLDPVGVLSLSLPGLPQGRCAAKPTPPDQCPGEELTQAVPRTAQA